MSKAYIARQMIVDGNQNIFAYDLAFRQNTINRAVFENADNASAAVLAAAVSDFGVRTLLGEKIGFVTLTPPMLYEEGLGAIPAKHFVLKLPLSKLTPQSAEPIEQLKTEGFEFAFSGTAAEFAAADAVLLSKARWLKLDISGLTKEQLTQFAAAQKGRLDRWIAQKVENYDQYALCKKLGFGGFQGYFFAKPAVMKGKKLSPSKLTVLQLVEELSGGKEVMEAKKVFDQNPELTLNLLRYLSSSYFSTRNPIKTIPQALSFLGRAGLMQWLMLQLYGAGKEDGRRSTLAEMAMLRARIMYEMAHKLGRKELAESAFMTGMISLLGPLFEMPNEEILSDIILDDVIKEAVLTQKGPLGTLLAIAVRIENGQFAPLEAWLKKMNKSVELLSIVLAESYAWVAQTQEAQAA